MEGKGEITAINGLRARVRIAANTECGGCVVKDHCHAGSTKEREITVINDYGAQIGDYVVFEARSSRVALSALLIWILPILSMIAGYIIAERFAGGGIAIVIAFIFLVLAFAILKVVDNAVSGGTSFYPVVTGISDGDYSQTGCPEQVEQK